MDPDLGGVNSALDSVTPIMAQPARPTDLVDTFFPLLPPSSPTAVILPSAWLTPTRNVESRKDAADSSS